MRQIIYIFTCPFHAKAGPALELSSSSNPHLQPWYFFLPTRPLFFYLWRQSSHSPYPFLPTTPFLYPSSFIAIIYQWRIQDFQNRGARSRRVRTPGMWGLFLCPPHIPYVLVTVENKVNIVSTVWWLQWKYMRVIQSKQNRTKFQTGGARPSRRSWIRLCILGLQGYHKDHTLYVVMMLYFKPSYANN